MTAKAPGKAFREGISLVELFDLFPDDPTAERWFEAQRWGEAGKPSHCPLCGCSEKLRPVASRNPLPYWCGDCRRHFSVKTGSVMHRSKIGAQKWAVAIYLWSTSLKGVSSMKLHRDLGITQKSAYFMAQRLREAWGDMPGNMAGPVEADEVYIGGKMRSMHYSRRKALKASGSDGKTAVLGIKDRASNKVSAKVIESADRDTLHGFLSEHVLPGAQVYTDEWRAYKGMPFEHDTVRHSAGEYYRDGVGTQGIESFWATIKRSHKGTYHKFSPKHLHRYLAEFVTRHNLRPLNTIDIMAETVRRMAGKRLTYADLIADNGLPSGARA